jgi:DNA-binding SARP family transcriptional activator
MQFAILGPLEVWADDRPVALGGPQQRALLAVLLLNSSRVVSTDRLMECLWGDDPPPTARGLLQGCVAQIRRALRITENGSPRQPLVTRRPGYVLELRPGELDLDRFEALATDARRHLADCSTAGLRLAADHLHDALSLWRGPALADVSLDACRADIARLAERRLSVFETRVEVDLRLGRYAGLIGELRVAVAEHPLRERLWALLMLALHVCDRSAEALETYRELRHTLVDQLGMEPNPSLRDLYRAILAGEYPLARYAYGAAAHDDANERVAAASAGATVVPAQLPAPTTAFTGRDQDLKRLDGLLADADDRPDGLPIAVVSGPPGVGKTALVTHWAHQVRQRFGDGQLYANLRGYAPTPPARPVEVLAGFLYALGVPPERIPPDLDQAAALYRSVLSDRRVLVVLDNAHGAEQVRPLLPGSPGCLVLVTGRDQMRGLVAHEGASHFRLDVLEPDEARSLLTRILGFESVHPEPATVEELATLCGRLPLALRIAAANLDGRPAYRLADYVAELAAADVLGGLAVDGDEQNTVRAAFNLSYGALDDPTRRVFRLLGLVPGPDFTAEAAAALAGVPVPHAARWLDRLGAAHLLERDAAGRFALHDLLRRFAAERCRDEDSDRADAARRLLYWYLHTADAAARRLGPERLRLAVPPSDAAATALRFDDHTAALAWLDAERPNLCASVHAAGAEPAVVSLLADALRGYFWHRPPCADWIAVADRALAVAEQAGDLLGQAAARLSRASADHRQSRYQGAIEHYARAVTLAEAAGWSAGQATALGSLGTVHWHAGRPRQAAAHLAQALAINRRTGWLAGQASNLVFRGRVEVELGRLDRAVDDVAEGLAHFRDLGARYGEAVGLEFLGVGWHALGRLDRATEHLAHARSVAREIGNIGSEAAILNALAGVHADAGRYHHAVDLATEAATLAEAAGDRRVEADTMNTLAAVAYRRGSSGEAIDLHGRALELAREAGARFPAIVALTGLAAAHHRLADPDQARVRVREALTAARQCGFRLLEANALAVLAETYGDRRPAGRAVAFARRALAIHRHTGYLLGAARALVVLGRLWETGSDADAAACAWREALDLLDQVGAAEAAEVRTLLAAA